MRRSWEIFATAFLSSVSPCCSSRRSLRRERSWRFISAASARMARSPEEMEMSVFVSVLSLSLSSRAISPSDARSESSRSSNPTTQIASTMIMNMPQNSIATSYFRSLRRKNTIPKPVAARRIIPSYRASIPGLSTVISLI